MANRFNNLPWYHVPEWGQVAYYTPALCGSQSLLCAILDYFEIEDPGFGHRRALVHSLKGKVVYTQYPPLSLYKVGFIRHPVDRFKSLLKALRRGDPIKVPYQLREYTPLQVLKHILLRLDENMHWIPQCYGLSGADHIVPLEEMGEHCEWVKRKEHESADDIEISHELWCAVLNLYQLDDNIYQIKGDFSL